MSREHAAAGPRHAQSRMRHGPSPSRSTGHAEAGAQSQGPGSGARQAGTLAILLLVPVVLVALTLLLLARTMHAGAVTPSAVGSPGSLQTPSLTTPSFDPRLVLVPRTATQGATADGLRMALAVSPLLPGPNRFEVMLAERDRPVAGGHVHLVVRMTEMAMRPVILSMGEVQPGRYAATGPLAMFGRWQVTVQIDRPGAASLRHQFTVDVDLPKGLLSALATRGAPQQ